MRPPIFPLRGRAKEKLVANLTAMSGELDDLYEEMYQLESELEDAENSEDVGEADRLQRALSSLEAEIVSLEQRMSDEEND